MYFLTFFFFNFLNVVVIEDYQIIVSLNSATPCKEECGGFLPVWSLNHVI